MHNQITLPLVLALGLRVVLASPVPVIEPPTTCAYPIESYTADTQTLQNGTPFIGAVSISGASGGTLSLTESYSVGITITEGGSLSLDIGEIIGLGLDFSVSETTTTTVGEGGNIPCPMGGWQCALSVTPTVLNVVGTQTISFENCPNTGSNPYDVLIPQVDSANNAIIAVDVCSCPDYDGWADDGAPAPCPGNCR